MRKQINVTSFINQAIASKLASINDTRRDIAKIRASKGTIRDLGKRTLSILDGLDVRMSVSCIWSNPILRFTVQDVDGFKNKRLTDALEMFMNQGFTESRTWESAEYLNREYTFRRGDLDVELNVYVRSDSPTCRRIPVGEKTITQTQYEIQCD